MHKLNLLALSIVTIMLSACSSKPENTPVSASPVVAKPKADQRVEVWRSNTTYSHQILAQDSTVATPTPLPHSNAGIGNRYWKPDSKAKNNAEKLARERSSYSTNLSLGVTSARQAGLDGAGVVVGVVDTGITPNDTIIPKDRIIGSTGEGNTDAKKANHGNEVAMVLAGEIDGIAPRAKLYDARHNGSNVGTALINAANNADIINYSGNSPVNAADAGAETYGAAALSNYTKIIKEGKLIIQSTGNDGRDNPNADAYALKLNPELQKGLIYVTATESNTDRSLGKKNDVEWANACGEYANSCLATSGYITYVTDNKDIKTLGGTSYAAPRVAGAAALLKQKYPWASNDVLRTIILTTADDLGEKHKYGWGMLNIDSAIKGMKQLPFGELETNVSAGVYAFSNPITGTGSMLKTGVGTLNLDGYSSFANLTIKAGKVNINNGFKGDVKIAGGTLGGEGLVANVISTGGTVDFQDGLAIIDLKLDDKSTTKIRLGRTAKVLNTARLDGTLDITSSKSTTIPKETKNAISIAKKPEGKFSNVTSPLMYTPTINYTNTGIDITMTPKSASSTLASITDTTSTSNQSAAVLASAANVVDGYIANPSYHNNAVLNSLPTIYSTTDTTELASAIYQAGDSAYTNAATALTKQVSQTTTELLQDTLSHKNGLTTAIYGGYKTADIIPANDLSGSDTGTTFGAGLLYAKNKFSVGFSVYNQHNDWDEQFLGNHQSAKSKANGIGVIAAKHYDNFSIAGLLSGTKASHDITQAGTTSDHDSDLLQLGLYVQKPFSINQKLNLDALLGTRLDRNYLTSSILDRNTSTPVIVSKFGLSYQNSAIVDSLNLGFGIEHDTKQRYDNAWSVDQTRYEIEAGATTKLHPKTSFGATVKHAQSKSYQDTSAMLKLNFLH